MIHYNLFETPQDPYNKTCCHLPVLLVQVKTMPYHIFAVWI